MTDTLSLTTTAPGALKHAIAARGWTDGEEILAAGQLRQGKAPSMLAMITGLALVEVLRPRRSRALPRHFVLAVTPSRVLAFKAWGGRGEGEREYRIRIRPGVAGTWARDAVAMYGLTEGTRSKGGLLTVDGRTLPVARPNLNGDPSTDELLAVLAA